MSPQPTSARATTTFEITRKQFDSVPRRRGFYIVAYAVFVLCIYGPRLLYVAQVGLPEPVTMITDVAGVAAFIAFSYHFISTLKIMGYEPWMILMLAMVSVVAIPGLFIVGFMDRRIATAWDRADPDRPSYRQKPPSYE